MNNLSQLATGKTARIKAFRTDVAVHQRLMTMGLLPGMEIKVVQVAPLDDPIAIEFNGQRLSLRRAEAAGILLEAD